MYIHVHIYGCTFVHIHVRVHTCILYIVYYVYAHNIIVTVVLAFKVVHVCDLQCMYLGPPLAKS